MFIDEIERERERERERKRAQDIDWLLPVCSPTGDRTHNLGMGLDWESNLQPFVVWGNAPTN